MKTLLLFILAMMFASCQPLLPTGDTTSSLEFSTTGSTNDSSTQVDSAIAPGLSELSPWGNLDSDIGQVVLKLKTSKRAICRYDNQDTLFQRLRYSFQTMNGGMEHQAMTVVSPNSRHTYYVRCRGIDGAENVVSKRIEFTTMGSSDSTPPMISSVLPMGELPSGTRSVMLQAMTNEASDCKYDKMGRPFVLMNSVLPSSNGLNHSLMVQVAAGEQYQFYIHCSDKKGNITSVPAIASFQIKPSGTIDNKPPVISMVQPSGDLIAGTKQISLSLVTDENADCRYSANQSNYDQMLPMSSTGNMGHIQLAQNLQDGMSYTYYFLCQDKSKNQSLLASTSFKVQSKPADDTTPPAYLSFSPNGLILAETATSVKLEVVTNENANCRYSLNSTIGFASMSPMGITGARAHSQDIPVTAAGNYTYFLRCSDQANNISAPLGLTFTLPDKQKDINELRAQVSSIFANRCLSCHGQGAQYVSVIDLSRDLPVIEKDQKYIQAKNPDASFLYQKLATGTMKAYLPDQSELLAIREWIEAIDPNASIQVTCPNGQEALDNVCVTVGKTLRSYGYRMVTPKELFKDINQIFAVSLENKDPMSGQPIVPEPQTNHGYSNQFGLVSANSVYITSLAQVADMLGAALEAKGDFNTRIVNCMTESIPSCGGKLASSYTEKLFRRQLNSEDLAVYNTYFAGASGDKKKVYIDFFKALIQSPSFIFRQEHGENPNPLYGLDAYEVASRLSYFISGRGPDAALIAKAKDGSIMQKAVRQQEAERLMQLSYAQQHLAETFMESIGIKKLAHEDNLSRDMIRETRTLVRDIFFSEKQWTDIFTSNYTFVNKRLADIYKLNVNTSDTNFIRVNYPNSSQRSGILTHASYLSAFYDGKDLIKTKDIRRGINFFEKVLCRSMPLPPADVDVDLDPANDLNGCRIDNRKQSTLNGQGTCVHCHQHFDRIGMGFERYNNQGTFRTVQEDNSSCSTIEPFYLDGGSRFNTLSEFTTAVAGNSNVGRCLAMKMKSYAYGTDTSTQDLKPIFLEMTTFKESMKFKDLIKDIVGNDEFIKREGRDD